MPIKIPDIAEIRRTAETRFAAEKAVYAENKNAFIGVSLEAWLAVTKAAGVPSVPATKIFELPRKVFLNFEENPNPDEPTWRALAAATKAVPAEHMLRWDPCSGYELKRAMAYGNPIVEACRNLHPDDPRAFDIIYEYPADIVPIWSRPWITTLQEAKFPVEFRVFVENNEILGVASYYPQRPLPNTFEIQGYVDQAYTHTESILEHLKESKQFPWTAAMAVAPAASATVANSKRFQLNKVSATLDFLVTIQGDVLFLEAGPPYGAGAHPCAFLGQRITGVALELASNVELH